jgi:predicted lipopolysaccharide heptosyltransferase III
VYRIVNRKKLIATMIADFVGRIIFFPRRLFARQQPIEPDDVSSILVIRTAYVGDVVMALPVLKPLKTRFPGAKISFLTSSRAAPLLERNPYVDEVLVFDPFWFYSTGTKDYRRFRAVLRKRSFDMVIETRADIRELLFLVVPARAKYKVSYDVGGGGYFLTHTVPYAGTTHRVEYHLNIARYLGCDVGEVEWGFRLTDKEKQEVHDLLNERGIKGSFIAVHPGARAPLKRWDAEKYALLCDRLMEKQSGNVVLLGSVEEREMIQNIAAGMHGQPVVLAGSLGLRQLAGVLKQASMLICNDSAPMHIAAMVGTPAVAIFGPSKSRETGPYGNVGRVVEHNFPCRFRCDEGTCRHAVKRACLESVTVEEVLDAVDKTAG